MTGPDRRTQLGRRSFTAAATATLLAPWGCARGVYTQVTEIWRTKEPIAVHRLLIIGVNDDPSKRLRFEGRTAQAFENAKVPAKSTEQLLGGQFPYPRPALVTLTEQNQLDGALVVRLISYDNTARVDISGEALGDKPRATWSNQLKHVYDAEGNEPVKVARAETALYEVSTEKLIWSGLSETFAPEDASEAIASYGRVMTETLINGGFVVPG
jgi:hypothetical protein